MKTTTIISPAEIISRHLKPAIRPFSKELLAAADLDAQLAAARDAIAPDKIKHEAGDLFERACRGDKEAENILTQHGGQEGYVRERSAMFSLARGKFEAHCKACAPLWGRVAAALTSALDASAADIQSQFDATLTALGELPGGVSLWAEKCRNMKTGLNRAEFASRELNHGASWQLEALGLGELLK